MALTNLETWISDRLSWLTERHAASLRRAVNADIKEAGRTVRAKRPVQQRKVAILSEEKFVESLKKRIPANKWDLGPSHYISSIAYRHFILMLKTATVA